METKFKFNSQVCTSRSQSEKLLALGLKKETADIRGVEGIEHTPTFAWSLGRLIKDLMPQSIGHLELAVGSDYAGYYEDRCESESGMWWEYSSETSDMFDNIISTIEWLIKKGYFNKEYLV